MKKIIFIFLFGIVFNSKAFSGILSDSASIDSTQKIQALLAKYDSMAKTTHPQSGSFELADGVAKVSTPEGFKFLDKADSKTLLTNMWNNPEDNSILGVLVPGEAEINSPWTWAITISYEESGHVKDDDASDINYDELLKQMQDACIDVNKERAKSGFEPITIVGWAQKPFYDKTNHKLYWAKEIKFGTDEISTLNYNIRVLGRKGVLVLNVVASINDLKMVNENINKIIASCNFNSGNEYDDFNNSTDKSAEYGVAGLIAGGILAKTGILAKIGFFLLAAWKLIAVTVVGAFTVLRKKIAGLFKSKEQFVLPDEQKKKL